MPSAYVPAGVIPAVLLPFHEDLSIDEASYRGHLRDVAAVDGISAITVNAHASEVASCSFEEQRRVLDITQDEIGDRLPLVHGVWADGSIEAGRRRFLTGVWTRSVSPDPLWSVRASASSAAGTCSRPAWSSAARTRWW